MVIICPVVSHEPCQLESQERGRTERSVSWRLESAPEGRAEGCMHVLPAGCQRSVRPLSRLFSVLEVLSLVALLCEVRVVPAWPSEGCVLSCWWTVTPAL